MRRTWIGTRILLGLTLVLVMAAKDLSFVQATGNWDVKHFANIARHGYADPLEMAFFPGLPAIMHAGSWIGLPPEITGVVVALVCSGLAAAALYRIGGAVPAMLWLIAPTAAFTTIGYSEAPFVAAAFWAWERARSNRWGQAAALAAVACTMRVSGLFLVGALAVMAVVGDGEKPARRRGSKRRIDVEQVC
ncbi:MAG: mannosyltransferase family protein, partial [Cutibacterium granulosum]|nr:mannosyltransferase family protein [Cutibacterium granulosum]